MGKGRNLPPEWGRVVVEKNVGQDSRKCIRHGFQGRGKKGVGRLAGKETKKKHQGGLANAEGVAAKGGWLGD